MSNGVEPVCGGLPALVLLALSVELAGLALGAEPDLARAAFDVDMRVFNPRSLNEPRATARAVIAKLIFMPLSGPAPWWKGSPMVRSGWTPNGTLSPGPRFI